MFAKKQKDNILEGTFKQFTNGKKLGQYDQQQELVQLKKYTYQEEQKKIVQAAMAM